MMIACDSNRFFIVSHENEFTAGKHSSTESLEDASKVEIQRFEPPRLVQPNEVKVSHMEIMEKMEPVSTNLG